MAFAKFSPIVDIASLIWRSISPWSALMYSCIMEPIAFVKYPPMAC